MIIIHYLFEVIDLSKSELIKEALRKYEGFAFNSGSFNSIKISYSTDQRYIVISQGVQSMDTLNKFCEGHKKTIEKVFHNYLFEKSWIRNVHNYITF